MVGFAVVLLELAEMFNRSCTGWHNVWNINEAGKRGGLKRDSLSLARMYIESTSL